MSGKVVLDAWVGGSEVTLDFGEGGALLWLRLGSRLRASSSLMQLACHEP